MGRVRQELEDCETMTACETVVLFIPEDSEFRTFLDTLKVLYEVQSHVSTYFHTLLLFFYPSTHSTCVSIINPGQLSKKPTVT